MHLIFSESLDPPTDKVLQWLVNYNEKVIYIDKNSILSVKFNEFDDPIFIYHNQEFRLAQIKSVWFRRSTFQFKQDIPLCHDKNINEYHKIIQFTVQTFLNYLFVKKTKSLGNPHSIEVNKLLVLYLAKEIGLKIPSTTLSDSTNFSFFFKKDIITKLLVPFTSKYENEELNFLTFDCDAQKLNEKFSISLFQKKIEKKFEVRVFYFKGTTYSKAIFSQKDSKTKTDYRNYNINKPNRVVPFMLPTDIHNKLITLMKKMNLDTGSIDFIVNKKNEFIFLEINPVGQFSDMSYNCNFYLEKQIADFLRLESSR